MKTYTKAALGALLLAGASFAVATPASAYVDVGISFGLDTPFDPCDYYDYYDEAPPWGLPDDYCDYPVYFEPVYFDGYWYRGPIYYRWNHGRRVFWLNGGWRDDGWRGPRPARITWRSHSGSLHHGGRDWRRNDGRGNWRGNGHDWRGGVGSRGEDHWRDRDNDDHRGNGGDRPWFGHRGDDHPRDGLGGGDRRHDGDRGNGGGDHGGGSHSGGGDHGGGGHFGGDHGGGSHSGGGDHGGGGHFGGDHGGGGNQSGGGGHHH